MTTQQMLLPVYRALRPVVDRCGLNALARPVWAALWNTRSKDLVRARQNGRTWWLDPEVALRGEDAEMETVEWLRSVIRPGMTVIDVGANVGQMTLEMAHLVGPAGQVIAIEPGPGNLAVLRRHIVGNGYSERVTVLAAACCASHGGRLELDLAGGNSAGVGSGFQLNGIGLAQNPLAAGTDWARTMVDTVSLDGVVADRRVAPAVIKIDVEGAELEVLRGARKTFAERRPAVRFGFHPFAFKRPAEAQAEIQRLFAMAGLTFEKTVSETWGTVEINVERCS